MKNIEDQILKLVDQAESILIMPSSPPDADSLGSAVAIYLALQKIGKTSTVVCADPVPDALKFLPMMSTISNEFSPSPDFVITVDLAQSELSGIQSELKENKVNIILTAKKGQFSADQVSFSHGANRYDLILTVDTATLHQLGRFYEDNVSLFHQLPVVNIDHHASNEQFGIINHVEIMSSSTTELVLGLFEAMEEHYSREIIDEDIATLLLAGTITDTGSFQNANTNPRSFANSAKMIKRGARQQEIIQHVFKTKDLSTLRLWGRILTNIKIEKDHRFLWSAITRKDFQETGSKAEETGGIIDELMTNAPDTDIVLLLKEKEDGLVVGSIRTTSDALDASEIAGFWGGGGHHKAAGFRIANTDIAQQAPAIIEKIKDYQRQRLNLHPQTTADTVTSSMSIGETTSLPKDSSLTERPNQSEKTARTQTTETRDPAELTPGTEPLREISSPPPVISEGKGPQALEPGVLYKFD